MNTVANQDLRNEAKIRNIRLWQIAYKLNMDDGNFSRKLRKELSPQEKERIFSIIEELSKEEEDSENRWIPVSEKLPETTDPVNITWVNRNPEKYYADIKDVPFTATGHYCNGRWYWFSAACQEYLDESGDCTFDRFDDAVEVTAWMPLPEPYKGGDDNA